MQKRYLNLKMALERKSHFLLGPRATGKSWLIRHQLKSAQVFDLLDHGTYDRLLRRPESLSEEITNKLVVLDEIQKIPKLLDEVHRLIETKGIRFLLTGSSARKLKHGGANLLAGRARQLPMYPLTAHEISGFDLVRYCNVGGLPAIYNSREARLDLRDYVHLYLKEEIIAESVVRKIDHYARFLDVIGAVSGEELNYEQIALDSGVPARTVSNFVEVLKDTLLAFELTPFRKTKTRKAISRSKLFVFDVGVANHLADRQSFALKSDEFGKAFEHFLIQETRAYLGYNLKDDEMMYWRTQSGTFEVDLVLGQKVAIEIKSAEHYQPKMLKGLRALKEEGLVSKFMLVSRDKVERVVDGIKVIPYTKYLELLWGHKIV
jgi:predicted AAA+ superfamily ATPase